MYRRKPHHNQTLLLVVSGSRAYGTARPDSDVDYKGVFVAHQHEIDGIYPLPDKDLSYVKAHDNDSLHATEVDWHLHEISKFCRLAANSNPQVLETLWSKNEHIVISTRLGEELLSIKKDFLSAPGVYGAYFESAKSQLRALRGDDIDIEDPRRAKHAKHIKRILVAGYQLWTTGDMSVAVDDPEEYHKFGEACQRDTTNRIIEDTVAEYEALFNAATSVLSDYPSLRRAHSLVALVRHLYASHELVEYKINV